MEIIPVLDLKAGIVVHARGGSRSEYLPLRSRLTPSVEPAAVLRALLGLHPFRQVYLADLDAIAGNRVTHEVPIQELRQGFPGVELWIDRGLHDRAGLREFLDRDLGTPVLGSETLADERVLRSAEAGEALLSLDYRGGRFLGPPQVEVAHGRWPRRVIVMELARVGAGMGPNFERLAALRRRVPGHAVYAAGGVQDGTDLERLRDMGVTGALVASALHRGDPERLLL